MSNRMSLEEAKIELTNRGYYVIGKPNNGYRVFKDGIDHTTLVTGRGIVKFAKEVLLKEYEQSHPEKITGYAPIPEEVRAEMRSVWEPGTVVVDVLTGIKIIV